MILTNLFEQVFQGYSILEYTAIPIVCQSESGDKDGVYSHSHIIGSAECPYSPFDVVIILFLHGIVATIEFHLAYVVMNLESFVYICGL